MLKRQVIPDYSETQLTVYPNLATNLLNVVSMNPVLDGEISIANQLGEVVKSIRILSGKDLQIQVTTLSPGIYYLVLKTHENEVLNRNKFVISE